MSHLLVQHYPRCSARTGRQQIALRKWDTVTLGAGFKPDVPLSAGLLCSCRAERGHAWWLCSTLGGSFKASTLARVLAAMLLGLWQSLHCVWQPAYSELLHLQCVPCMDLQCCPLFWCAQV